MAPSPLAKGTAFNLPQALAQALALHKQGRPAEAERLYMAILAERPDHFDALQMLALIKLAKGEAGEALRLVSAAMRQRKPSPQILLNQGMILHALNRSEEALASFDAALKQKSKFAEAHNNRGAVLAALGRDEEALPCFDRALALKPDYAEAHYNRGSSLRVLGRLEEALGQPRARAVATRPITPRRTTIAAPCWKPSTASRKRSPATKRRWRSNRTSPRRARTAAACCSTSAAPTMRSRISPPASRSRRTTPRPGIKAAANCSISAATKRPPPTSRAPWRSSPNMPKRALPTASPSCRWSIGGKARSRSGRAAYEGKLVALRDDLAAGRLQGDLMKAIGARHPFLLAYQGGNDRALQEIYGGIVSRIVAQQFEPAPLPPPPAPGEPIRVGIVSGFFFRHSNWKIPIKGWLSQLDRSRFRVSGYHLGVIRDDATTEAAALCDRFVHRTLDVAGWRREILADAPHVLIYPGLLMDTLSVQLAAQRLAPVQCNSWGHPETSGLPTLDYFLSSDLMEPPEADAYYTEKLVRLPNLSIHYEPVVGKIEPVTRAEFGLRDSATVFWSAQSLYKYLPQYDAVFPRIARAVPDSQFVFLRHFGGPAITAIVRERIEASFAAAGLNAADHCVFLERLSQNKFVAAAGLADIFLDTIGWSACNSALESLTHDLPIVTLAGPMMRGRHSAAILACWACRRPLQPRSTTMSPLPPASPRTRRRGAPWSRAWPTPSTASTATGRR